MVDLPKLRKMKNLLLGLMALCLVETAHAQQFSFQMFFSDAIGNKDTLTLGYDVLATDTIDAAFGEVNMIGVPLDTSLDVRITNEWMYRSTLDFPGIFHTKKQITFYDCHDWSGLQTIDILTKHWPVTVSWDNTLFMDNCRNGSLFASINPGGWFDTGSPSDLWRQVLNENGSVTFTSNNNEGFSEYYSYINETGDTIPVFWQIFSDSTILYLGMNEFTADRQKAVISPNPTTDIISIRIPSQFGNAISVEIFSSTGNLVLLTTKITDINIAGFERGLYLVVVTNAIGEIISARMIKEVFK